LLKVNLLHCLVKQNCVVDPKLSVAEHEIFIDVDVIKALVSNNPDVFSNNGAVWVEELRDRFGFLQNSVAFYVF
jgi:hypothetical protein